MIYLNLFIMNFQIKILYMKMLLTLSEFNKENLNNKNNIIREIHHVNAKDLINKNDLFNDN